MIKVINERSLSGFHMTFANGYTVSVQTGRFNCADPDKGTAEVAAWNDKGWVKLSEYDDVIGHQTADEVLKIMNRIARRKPA